MLFARRLLYSFVICIKITKTTFSYWMADLQGFLYIHVSSISYHLLSLFSRAAHEWCQKSFKDGLLGKKCFWPAKPMYERNEESMKALHPSCTHSGQSSTQSEQAVTYAKLCRAAKLLQSLQTKSVELIEPGVFASFRAFSWWSKSQMSCLSNENSSYGFWTETCIFRQRATVAAVVLIMRGRYNSLDVTITDCLTYCGT